RPGGRGGGPGARRPPPPPRPARAPPPRGETHRRTPMVLAPLGMLLATKTAMAAIRTQAADTAGTRPRVDNLVPRTRTIWRPERNAMHGRGDGGPRTGSRTHGPLAPAGYRAWHPR